MSYDENVNYLVHYRVENSARGCVWIRVVDVVREHVLVGVHVHGRLHNHVQESVRDRVKHRVRRELRR